MKKFIVALLVLSLLLTGCGTVAASDNLMEGYIPQRVPDKVLMPEENPTNFAVTLFQNSVTEGKNTLISPLSILSALAMTANGAEGETLSQMENTLGATRAQLNSWLHSYMSQRKEDDVLYLANAIWFNTHERFKANGDFLQTNADFFGAGIHGAPFDDATCREINSWVKDNTDGMIDGILDHIPEEAVMYLVNALAFDARWASVYTDSQVKEGTFTTEDGREQTVELMYDTLHSYLETENAAGFLRHYKGSRYAFVALLPNEGTTVAQLVESMDGESLSALLATPQNTPVAAIPKFETESMLELNAVLQAMGMEDAFDPVNADFSGLGTSSAGNIHISRVLHKTYISVAEKGTRAGAATVVENTDRAMALTENKSVILNRPFVYMLIDCESNLPFFMGTCMEIGA